MITATLHLSSPDSGPLALIILSLGAVILLIGYWRSGMALSARFLAFALKTVAIAAIAWCLLEPLWLERRAKPGANYFAILADNSQGMRIKDPDETLNRSELLRDFLTSDESTWSQEIEKNFRLRRYSFDSRVHTVKGFGELDFQGRLTGLNTALHSMKGRYEGRPLAGMLLFTDGNATDLGDELPDLSGLPPVYPVVSGTDEPIKDITIASVTSSESAFEDAPVTLTAQVEASGYYGEKLIARLFDLEENEVESQILDGPGDQKSLVFRFQIRPEKVGVSFYRLRVSALDEESQFENPSLSEEATLANNTRLAVVDRVSEPYRILYVAGRPNWEFKFLKRALEEDDLVQLVGIIRIAKQEPKFQFKGRKGETSNPLYKGFDKTSEETQRYDEAVLIRLGTRDEEELREGFPIEAEDLFEYHGLILDDLESGFFRRSQMNLVQRFVSERGGGFLMLGGQESFHQGDYHRTPIGDLLPVYLDRVPETPALSDLKLELTREGWLQPWIRLRTSEGQERERFENLKPHRVMNPVRGVKPGGSVLMTAADGFGDEHPALVTQRFGLGRAGALLIGDFWRSRLQDEAKKADVDKAWRQMIRWLVSDVPRRIELEASPKPNDASGAMLVRVRVRDKTYKPLDNAMVQLDVQQYQSGESAGVSTNRVPLLVEPSRVEAGLYEAAFSPKHTGGYIVNTLVTDANGLIVGREETGWTSDPAADEFRALNPNRGLLESIARETGGRVLEKDELAGFAKDLPSLNVPITETSSKPLWNHPLTLALAFGCLAAEWGIRRRKGLA